MSFFIDIISMKAQLSHAETEILSRMAESQAKFQSDLLELLRKSTNS